MLYACIKLVGSLRAHHQSTTIELLLKNECTEHLVLLGYLGQNAVFLLSLLLEKF